VAEVDALIRELAEDGRLDSTGSFTLDRRKALEKMQRFQLADPLASLLLIVQAAHYQGATRIRFDIDTNDIRIAFDGPPFSRADLDGLFDVLLGHHDAPALRARRELALGVNAALGMNPAFVRLESGDGLDGAALVARPGEEPTVERAPRPPTGTTFWLRERFSPRALVEFFRHRRGTRAASVLVRERCAFAEFPILLGDEVVSRGLSLPDAAFGEALTSPDARIRAVVGLTPAGTEPPRACFVVAGVTQGGHTLEGIPDGFRAMVRANHLRKDASHAHVVTGGDDYEATLAFLREAWETLVRRLLARAEAGDPELDPPLARVLTLRVLRELSRDGVTFWRRGGECLMADLARLPILRCSQGRPLTLTDLAHGQTHAGSPIGFTDRPFEVGLASGARVTLAEDVTWTGPAGTATFSAGDLLDTLSRVFAPRQLEDATDALDAAARREERRLAFLARTAEPYLAGGVYAKVPIAGAGLRGELGLLRGAGTWRESLIRTYLDGRLLGEEAARLPLPSVAVAVEGPFEPDATFTRPERDEALADAWRAILAALPALARACVGELERLPSVATGAPDRPRWRRGRAEPAGNHDGGDVHRVPHAERILTLLALYDALIEPSLSAAMSRSLELDRRARGGEPLLSGPLLEPTALLADPTLTRPPAFRTVDDRAVALIDLIPLAVIPTVSEELPPIRDAAELTLRPTPLERRILGRLFGEDRIEDASARHTFALLEAEHLQKAPVRPRLVGPLIARARLAPTPPGSEEAPSTPRLEGEVGLPASTWFDAPTLTTSYLASVLVLVRERPVTSAPIALPFPLLSGLISWDGLTPTPTWEAIEPDEAFATAQRHLREAAHALAREACARIDADRGPDRPALRRWLLATLPAIFPDPRFFRAFVALWAGDPAAAPARYLRLHHHRLAIGQRLREALRQPDERSLDAIVALTDELEGVAPDPRLALHLHDGRVEPLASLLDAPLFIRLDALPPSGGVSGFTRAHDLGADRSVRAVAPATLAELVDQVAATRGVDQIDAAAAAQLLSTLQPEVRAALLAEGPVLFLTAFERQVVTALLGPQRVRDARGRVHRAIMRRRFLNQPVRPIALDPHAVLSNVPVRHEDITGRLGIARERAQGPLQPWRLTLFTEGREVETRDGQWGGPAIVAALDVPGLALNAQFAGVAPRWSPDACLAAAESALPAAFRAFEGAWDLLVELPAARHHLLAWLGTRPDAPDAVAALSELPIVRRVDGERLPLSALPPDEELLTLDHPLEGADSIPRPSPLWSLVTRPTLALDAAEQTLLRPLTKSLRRATQEVHFATLATEAMLRAPRLPARGPGRRLAAVELDRELLDGELVLPLDVTPDARPVAGAWGRVAGEVEASPRLPAAGVVRVPAGQLGRRFEGVELTGRQRSYLASQVAVLYTRAASRLARGDLDPAARAATIAWCLLAARRLVRDVGSHDALWALLRALPLLDHPRWPSLAAAEAAGDRLEVALAYPDRTREHLARSPIPLTPPFGAVAVPLAPAPGDPAMTGWIGVLPRTLAAWGATDPSRQDRRATITLAKHGRAVTADVLDVPCGPLDGAIDSDAFVPTFEWDAIYPDAALDAAHRAVLAAAPRLVELARERYLAGESSLRPWLLACIAHGTFGDALAEVPLFFGVERGSPVTLAELRAVHARDGAVPVLRQARFVGFEPSRLVLAGGARVEAALVGALGEDALEDAAAWLDEAIRERRFVARPQVERVALPAHRALLTRPLLSPDECGAPLSGEAGLSANLDPGTELTFYRDRRLVGVVAKVEQVATLAAIDAPDLSLTEDLEVNRDAAFHRCREAARLTHRELLRDAAARLRPGAAEPFDDDGRAHIAYRHILRWLALAEDRGGADLEDVPGLRGVDGRRYAVADLRATAEARRAVLVVDGEPRERLPALDEDRRILATDAEERRLLEAIFGRVVDVTPRWPEEVAAWRRRQALPAFAVAPPEGALVVTPMGRGTLEGALWLPHDPPLEAARVALGRHGLEVGREALAPLPVAGAVAGAGVEVDLRWQRATLSEVATRALRDAAVATWEALVSSRAWAAEDARGAAARRVLRAGLGALRGRDTARRPNARERRLLSHRLMSLPLFWRQGGRRLSALELNGLGYPIDDALLAMELEPARAQGSSTPPSRSTAFALALPRFTVDEAVVAAGVPTAPTSLGGLQLTVHREGRRLATVRLPFPLSPLAAAVDGDIFAPAPDWSGLHATDTGASRVAEALWRRAGPLVVDALGGLDAPGARALAEAALAAAFPTTALTRAYQALLRLSDVSSATTAYRELLSEASGRPIEGVQRALVETLARDEVTAGDLGRALRRLPGGRPGSPLGHACVPGLPGFATDGADAAAEASGDDLLLALVRAPLFARIGGEACSLEAIALALSQGQEVGSLTGDGLGDEALAAAASLDRMVLDLRGDEALRLATAVVGRASLVDARRWLRQRAAREAFLARPEEPHDFASDDVLVAVPVRGEGLVGALALPRPSPEGAGGGGPAEVTLLREGRPVGVEALAGVVPGARARVRADGLALDETWTRAAPGEVRDRAIEAVEAAVPEVIAALADRLELLDGAEHLAAVGHILDFLGAGVRPLTDRGRGLRLPSPLHRRLAAAPLFEGAGGEGTSLDRLAAAWREHGVIATLARAPEGEAPDLAQRRVIVADEPTVRRLRRLFGEVVRVDDAWRREARREARLRDSVPWRAPDRHRALAWVDVSTADLRGAVYLPGPADGSGDAALAAGISLVVHGRVLGRLEVGHGPVAGFLSGAAVTFDDDALAARVRADRREVVRAAIRSLVGRLAKRLATDPSDQSGEAGQTDRGDEDGPVEDLAWLTRARELARQHLLGLHARWRAGAMAGAPDPAAEGGAEGVLHQDDLALLERLRRLPILEVGRERLYSLDTALALRPAALGALGLWRPGDGAATRDDGTSRDLLLANLREELGREPLRGALGAVPLVVRDAARRATVVATSADGALWLEPGHPLVAAALEAPDDPWLLIALASAVATAANPHLGRALTGEGERALHETFIRRARARFGAR